jgi:NDP-sugar pyrophosphorylase family protein
MDALILAGGKGTRLASVVADRPKPLALLGDKPFLDYVIAFLNQSGLVDHIIIAAGYRAGMIRAWAKTAAEPQASAKISVITEAEPLGTGGALRNAYDRAASGSPVFVLNGDSFIGLDLAAMLKAHRACRCAVTMAVTQIADSAAFGEVRLDGDRVVAFHEKTGEHRPGLINAGIYIIERSALARFPAGACSLEYDVMPRLCAAGLHAYRATGAFVDIGTPATYCAASAILGVASPAADRHSKDL